MGAHVRVSDPLLVFFSTIFLSFLVEIFLVLVCNTSMEANTILLFMQIHNELDSIAKKWRSGENTEMQIEINALENDLYKG